MTARKNPPTQRTSALTASENKMTKGGTVRFDYTEDEKDLIVNFKVAEAKAALANEYSFPMAFLAAAVVYLKWENWFFSIVVFALGIYWIGRAEKKRADKLEEGHERLMNQKYSDALSDE
jgi:hypothetical protein